MNYLFSGPIFDEAHGKCEQNYLPRFPKFGVVLQQDRVISAAWWRIAAYLEGHIT